MADDGSKILTAEDLTRREFGARSLATGAALATGTTSAAEAADPEVDEADVTITTADGMCDAAVYHPKGKGRWPSVVVFTDALGLRPAFRGMGKRLASAGYSVLVPNPFYRSAKSPVFDDSFSFTNPADMAKLAKLREPMTVDAVVRDATTWLAWLDAQPFAKTKAKAGVVGYCMGGPMTLLSAAAVPARIGGACSFHGGGLVTEKPDSPHLLAAKVNASYYFGVAANDDQRQPDAKDKLKQVFADANRPAKIEVYDGCMHGWCVPGSAVYNQAGAERAWAEMLALYKTTLV